MLIRTSFFHQGYTLLGRSSVVFTIILLIFYSTSFWFSCNAAHFGLLAIFSSLLMAHYLLRALESNLSCKLCSLFFKGKPPVIYRHWLKLEQNTFAFGIYKLLYSAIDNVSLSPFGNLVFKSTALSGPSTNEQANPGTVVLRLPISALSLKTQQEFITLLKEKCPQARLSPSIEAILAKPVLKSTTYIHILTLAIFIAILADVGHSTFEYIELLKRYYLSQKSASEQHIDQAKKEYQSAEWLKAHCSRFSLVTPKLLNNSSTAAGLLESRSKALWGIGETQEALNAQIEAAKIAPKSFKINLRLARLYTQLKQTEQAKMVIDTVSERHKHALIPKLYTTCLLVHEGKQAEAIIVLKDYLSFLDNDYFSPPPVWPPAGEDAIHELFVRDDLEFLLTNLEVSSTKKPK